jgi:hypothetical protein
MDGVRSPCGITLWMLDRGWAVEAPWDNTATVWNPISGQYELAIFTVDWDNGYYGFVPIGANYGGDGTWSWRRPGGGRPVPRERGQAWEGSEADGVLSQGHIPKIDHLPTSGREFGEKAYDRFYNIVYDLVNNPNCVDAFKDLGIDLVDLLANRGIRIGPSHLFRYEGINFKERLGLTDAGLKNAQGATNAGIANAYTIGQPIFLVEKSLPTILITGSAYIAGTKHLAETFAHELVHAGGIRGRQLSGSERGGAAILGSPSSSPHDLDHINGFNDLINKCTGHFK